MATTKNSVMRRSQDTATHYQFKNKTENQQSFKTHQIYHAKIKPKFLDRLESFVKLIFLQRFVTLVSGSNQQAGGENIHNI